MSHYGTKSILINDAAVAVAISQTDKVVSDLEQISSEDSRDMYIFADCSSVTGGAGVIKLQQSYRKDGTYTDVSSVTITAAGTFTIEYNEVDGSGSALKPFIRLVATTGAGDTFTIDRLLRTRRI